jgi:outer membrane lipopolysaccharide assembly protein LptE/RlpB
MSRLRITVLALLATGALAGCGDELQDANDAIDRGQQQVDEAQDTIKDPVGRAEREARERLDDAAAPVREAERRVDEAKDVIEDPVGAAEREADRALEDAISPQDQP